MPTKRERVESVVRGQLPDRPPVSFWHHFAPHQATGQPAVDAHLPLFKTYEVDFLMVITDHIFPGGGVVAARTAGDLAALPVFSGDEVFVGQLEVLSTLRRRLGPDVCMCTTLFNPWALLRYLTQPPSDHHGPPVLSGRDVRDETISSMLKEDRQAVKAALATIAESLGAFARECIRAGADGVFLSCRDDWVNVPANGPDTYDEMVRDLDLKILEAASAGTFNVLHICGRPQNFAAFAKYPVHVLNWADRAAGPSLAYARDRVKPAIAGGVCNLNTLPKGTPDECAFEVRDAVRQARHRPIIITPGCTYDPQAVPQANLKAVVTAARQLKS